MPGRVIATIFAFAAFAASLVYGAYLGVSSFTLMTTAMMVMLACYAVGRFGGYVIQRCVDDHIERYRAAHPIPDEEAAMAELHEHELSAAAEP
ncbi:MAG: hypothetical protein AAF797_05975 [Planctomycetota bacterium]